MLDSVGLLCVDARQHELQTNRRTESQLGSVYFYTVRRVNLAALLILSNIIGLKLLAAEAAGAGGMGSWEWFGP
jgi:hypothetical protein